MSRRAGALAGVLLVAGCAARGGADPEPADPAAADPGGRLALAALLLKDGHAERAAGVLREVDPSAEGLDLPRLHTLRGLVALHQGEHAAAVEALEAALAAGQTEPVVHVYLAQARYALDEPAAALAALEAAGDAWRDMPGAHRMRIHCRWRLGRPAAAFAALAEAEARFPGDAELAKQRVLYLLELGLGREAVAAGEAYLDRAGGTAEAHLALGEALRRSRQADDAARVLETARLRFPEEGRVRVALAHAHLEAGRPRSAAVVLEEAAWREPRYLAEAAELYRRAGQVERALYLNAELRDQAAKARQRLGLLLERGDHERAAALAPRLSRLGLLDDEEVRYALAYVCYRTGDLDRAAERLRGITRPDLFGAASELRKAIDAERARPEPH